METSKGDERNDHEYVEMIFFRNKTFSRILRRKEKKKRFEKRWHL